MWPNLQLSADLVTFTEEILNEKLHFLYSAIQKFLTIFVKTLYRRCLTEF